MSKLKVPFKISAELDRQSNEIKEEEPESKCNIDSCSKRGVCDPNTGACECYSGTLGANCERKFSKPFKNIHES